MIEPSINVPLEDVKQILAEYFGVESKKVVKNQYSFTRRKKLKQNNIMIL